MIDELKPCPFCAGDAVIRDIDHSKQGYNIVCKNDNCVAYGPWDLGRSGATETWNTRPIEDALRAQLASLQSRLAAYEEGFDPIVKLPKEFELVLANSKAFGWRTVQYSHEYFDEGSCGVGFGIKGCIRWFPLPGSKGGEE